MRKEKTKLTDGTPCFAINIRSLVTIRVFVIALADYKLVNKNTDFSSMSKKEAERILQKQLFFSGIDGENSQYEDADWMDEYNQYCDEARTFITKNYPYLNKE